MADFYLRRVANGLMPADEASQELLANWPQGDIRLAKVSSPRNLGHHRKFFALLDVAWDCGGSKHFDNREALRAWLICKAGHFDVMTKTKTVGVCPECGCEIPQVHSVVKPHSMSFANMSQETFEQLYSKVLDVILEHVSTSWTREQVQEAVEAIVGFG